MPSRRSHSKSRSGCVQCKKRKVKCNEQYPICKQCTKRGIHCSYQETPSSTSSPSSARLGGHHFQFVPSPDFRVDLSSIPGERPLSYRTLELRLFHHFSHSTSVSVAHDIHGSYFCQKPVPILALSYPFLLDAILTFSALHLASLASDNGNGAREPWIRIAMTYHDRALVGFNEVLADITEANCEAAALCSIFVLLITLAVLGLNSNVPRGGNRMTRGIEGEDIGPVPEIVGLRRLMRGCQLILEQSEPTLMSGEFKDYFGDMFARSKRKAERSKEVAMMMEVDGAQEDKSPSVNGADPNVVWQPKSLDRDEKAENHEIYLSVLNSSNRLLESLAAPTPTAITSPASCTMYSSSHPPSPLQSLPLSQSNASSTSYSNTETYQQSIRQLLDSLTLYRTGEYLGSMISWTLHIPPPMVRLLEEKDVVACLIFVLYGTALHLMREKWFVNDAGRAIIRALLPVVEGSDRDELAKEVAWIRKAVGIEA